MTVIGGERRADLVITYDWQVDEKAKDAGAEEIPNPDGDQEPDRPTVKMHAVRCRLFARPDESPGLEG